ncbi:hypothetical protein HPB50_015195 [Hyalomma asiaticum]|uniref:Uncharacterized protein n=1 Tax=Hyalomma asiaticum TaxID=266040 RepID=A0ACB7SNL3_HYAAI|nr:hypothetical protein HPB50_015195 [Hyalomma asiaticum]
MSRTGAPLLPHRRQLHVATPGDRLANTCGSWEVAGALRRRVRWSGLDDAILRQRAGLPPHTSFTRAPYHGSPGASYKQTHRRAVRLRSPRLQQPPPLLLLRGRRRVGRGGAASLWRRILWDALRLKDGGTGPPDGNAAERT